MPLRLRNTLVVDDELAIHEMYDLFLKPFPETPRFLGNASDAPSAQPEGRNFNVLHAAGGEEAIHVAQTRASKNKPIQVAFVDLKMSPIDGVTTIKELHAIDPRIIFVIVTGLPEAAVENVLQQLENILVQIILKPFEAEQIYNVAEELCGQWARSHDDS